MIKNKLKITLLSAVLLFVSLFAAASITIAATNDFTADGNVTVTGVTFGATTADMLILNTSTAESWTFNGGAFTVTNSGTFKIGSSDSSVKSIIIKNSGSSNVACSENSTPGTSYVTIPTASDTYTTEPSTTTDCGTLCATVTGVATFASFPTCAAATCSSGYVLSGATCVASGGGSSGSSTPSSTTGQAAATPANGGVISKTNADGTSAKIVLPAGALTANAVITISPTAKAEIAASMPAPSGRNIIGNYAYNFTAVSGLNIMVNTFEKALSLTFTYTNEQAEGINEEALKVHYWNETSNAWVALADSAVNATNNTVTATTAHFTYFAILGSQAEEETPATPTSEIMDGDIIQCQTCSDPFAVYIVKVVGSAKYIRHIVSIEIFNHYSHLKWENLKQVSSLGEYSLSGWARYNTGANNTAAPTDKVYEINGDQTKHWINMTAEQFLSHGGSEPAIYTVNQGELNLYAAGPDVMSL